MPAQRPLGRRRRIDPAEPADYRCVTAQITASGRSLHGVVHAWSLDSDGTDAQQGVVSAMLLAKTLLGGGTPPRLWILTRGGQPISADDDNLAPAQAPVWGLARSIAVEHPELACVAIDLDPTAAGGNAAELDAVAAMLATPDSENQVALRGAVRLAARIAHRAPAGPAVADLSQPWRLEQASAGTLDSFRRAPLTRRPPGAGEVEIAVEASSVNFRDVLNALGLYPGDAGPLGGECAGRVAAVGAGVHHVRPGDAVLAVAGGSMASHVSARAELTQRRPAGVSVEDAASFPIAYLTAEVCLGHVARLAAGERVLIHAGAGGVGMAAIRLAQRTGAEVFATAGSDWKRELLRDMGVAHVFDSRAPGFADAILTLTGGRGVDVVLNSLSGAMIDESFRAIARGGRFCEIGKRGIWSSERVAALGRDIAYSVIDWGETATRDPALIGGMFKRLVDELERGTLQPLPRHVFAVDDAPRAFRLMAQARHAGKIVLRHIAAAPAAVRRDGTYLITGGLSGLGLVVARALAERGAGRLVLIGRRGVTAEAAPVLDAIRAGGTAVVDEAIDVSDASRLHDLLVRIRADGPPLRGVIHSAGTLDDAALIQQDATRFARVAAPKIDGANALDRLTRLDPLDWFVMFSSVAALLGAPGQANHAAANAFLDLLAHDRRNRGLPALSVDWGAWSEVGAAADQRVIDRLADQGMYAMTPVQGLAALDRLLVEGAVQTAVLSIDWQRYIATVCRGVAPTVLAEIVTEPSDAPTETIAAPSRGSDLRHQVAAAPAGRRRALVGSFVRERVAHALGMTAKAVDPRTPLGELGLDSLLAVELRNTLGSACGQALPATLLFDYPTVDALTEHLLAGVLNADGVAPATDTAQAPPSVPNTVRAIEDLSDDEVDRLFAARLRKEGVT